MSGHLIMNSLVMYDHQTDSLWSQFLGEGVGGQFAGVNLKHISSQLVKWSAWKKQHPDTLVLDKLNSTKFDAATFSLAEDPEGLFSDPYNGYYTSRQAGINGETVEDNRLPLKENVVGVRYNDAGKAYPFSIITTQTVVNDTLNGRQLVVTFESDGATVKVFDRNSDDQTLTFEATPDSLVMTDAQTGTTWSKVTGEAIDGPLAGTTLESIRSFVSFWFAWKDFYPDTELYEGGRAIIRSQKIIAHFAHNAISFGSAKGINN